MNSDIDVQIINNEDSNEEENDKELKNKDDKIKIKRGEKKKN